MIQMMFGSEVPAWVAVLATYLLHGVAWAAVATLLSAILVTRSASFSNWLWRIALCAPLISTALATSLPASWRPYRVELGAGDSSTATRRPALSHSLTHATTRRAPSGPGASDVIVLLPASAMESRGQDGDARTAKLTISRTAGRRTAPLGAERAPGSSDLLTNLVTAPHGIPSRALADPATVEAKLAPPAIAPTASLLGAWPQLLLGLLFALAALGLSHLGWRAWRLRRLLADRVTVHDPRLLAVLRRLTAKAGLPRSVRLSESDRLKCPIAMGAREICLPAGTLADFDDELVAAVLAHELAHLERADNLWLWFANLLESVALIQPATRFVRRQLQATAELACDDRAVALTGDGIALARSLAEVASLHHGHGAGGLAHAMASPGGLVHRVERLLAGSNGGRLPAAARLATLVALVAVAALAPAVLAPAEAAAPPVLVSATSRVAPGSGVTAGSGITGRSAALAALPAATAGPRLAFASSGATVPNDKPGAPRLPARQPAVPAGLEPAPSAGDAFPRRTRRGRRFPPIPADSIASLVGKTLGGVIPRASVFAGEIASLEMQDKRLGSELAAARAEVDRLGKSGDGAERRIAEARVAELARQHETVQRKRQDRQKTFERDMESWGKEMEAWGKDFEREGERFGREMESWAWQFAVEGGDPEQRIRRDAERARRDADRTRREAERVRREQGLALEKAERMAREVDVTKRKADDLKQAAERLRLESERMKREAERLQKDADALAKPGAATGAR